MGPSRIVWFVLGAGAATYWINKRERDGNPNYMGFCRRPAVQPPANTPPIVGPVAAPANAFQEARWPQGNTSQPYASPKPGGWSNFDEDKLASQMAEITESTLDTVLATAAALKQRLADHRLEREKERQEQQRKNQNPPHMV